MVDFYGFNVGKYTRQPWMGHGEGIPSPPQRHLPTFPKQPLPRKDAGRLDDSRLSAAETAGGPRCSEPGVWCSRGWCRWFPMTHDHGRNGITYLQWMVDFYSKCREIYIYIPIYSWILWGLFVKRLFFRTFVSKQKKGFTITYSELLLGGVRGGPLRLL